MSGQVVESKAGFTLRPADIKLVAAFELHSKRENACLLVRPLLCWTSLSNPDENKKGKLYS